jgi:hypothetical protein
VWALSRLLAKESLVAMATAHRPAEHDPAVADEWAAALG